MLRKCLMTLMLACAVAGAAACSSHPDDRGDVTGRNESNNRNASD